MTNSKIFVIHYESGVKLSNVSLGSICLQPDESIYHADSAVFFFMLIECVFGIFCPYPPMIELLTWVIFYPRLPRQDREPKSAKSISRKRDFSKLNIKYNNSRKGLVNIIYITPRC